MSSDSTVASWLAGARQGDPTAAQALWQRYFQRLVQLANERLPTHARRSFDGEDVALSAFRSFLAAVGEGRYPDLQDKESLWNLLVTITARKAVSYLRHQRKAKRGGGEVRGESVFARPGLEPENAGIDQIIGDEPTPEFACQVADQLEHLLSLLDGEELRTIAGLRMEGCTVEEIADRMGCARRTVERRLLMIRTRWQEAGVGDEPE